MKAIRLTSALALIGLMLTFSGCENGFDELQQDPTKPATVNPEFLFTESLVRGMSDDIIGIRTEIWTLMVWNQQVADIRGVQTANDFYTYGAAAGDEVWGRWFTGSLINLREMMRLVENDPGSINKYSIARIWKAYMFHRITDLWGDVPYFQALEANSDNSDLSPAYDSQQAIYTDLLKELEEAVEAMNPDLESLGLADPLFGGDLDLWARFANSLRLRLAIRISAADPSLARQHGEAVLASGQLIEDESHSVRFPHDVVRAPSIFALFNTLVDDNPVVHYYPSQTFINLLETNQDPRLDVFSDPTDESVIFGNDDFVGVPNLTLGVDLQNYNGFNTSGIDDFFSQAPIEGNTMSYSEVCFLRAEAGLLGWAGSGGAQTQYEEGVRANMAYYNVADTSIANYLAGAGAYQGTLEQIITEKWITFQYRDGFEPFAELRRTGFPILRNADETPIAAGSFPQRLPYPESELLYNTANVNAVGVGINDLTTKMWWAQ